MDKLFNKYQGYLIENAGSYKSEDFIKFAQYAKCRMKEAAEKKNIKLISFYIGHYDISGFFQSLETGKYAYFSFDNCRYTPLDFTAPNSKGFLLRIAESPEDYMGGHNHFTDLKGFIPLLEKLVIQGDFI